MKRIAANLTPLVTCPAFLLWHVLGAVLCIPAFVYAWTSAGSDAGGQLVAFALPAWTAYVLTSLQRDILARPFSFCLPGQRDVVRSTTFLVGIAASLAASLPVLTLGGIGDPGILWAGWSSFCFGLSVFLVIVSVLFAVDQVAVLLGPLMPMVFVLVEFPDARIFVQEAALFAPVWNSAIMAALSLFVWKRLGSVDQVRRICGRRFLSLQMAWRRAATEEFVESGKRIALSRRSWSVRDRLLQRCFDRIGRRPPLSFRRHLAAMQYELAGRLVPLSPWVLPIIALAMLALLTIAGYAPVRDDRPEAPEANAVYVLACVIGLQLRTPMSTTMLLPLGRRERFRRAFAVAGCNGLVVLGISMLLYVTLQVMGALAPNLTLGGEIHRFRPADLEPAFVPLFLLPVSILLKLTCKTWLLVPEVLLLGSAIAIIVRGGAAVKDLGPSAITALLLVSWALLAVVLHARYSRRDLVPE